MASPQAEAIHAMVRSLASGTRDSVPTRAEQRAMFERMEAMTAEPQAVNAQAVDAGGVPAVRVVPEGADDRRVVLYLHGGGYSMGSAKLYRKLAGHIARAAGASALVLDYRLAPEAPFPAGLDDAVAAYEWLLNGGFAPEAVAFVGDSAGSGLALAAQLAARGKGLPLPAASVLISPWVDLARSTVLVTVDPETDLFVSDALLKMMTGLYLNGHDPTDPLVSPLYGDLSGFGPIHVQAGSDEVLFEDVVKLTDKARRERVALSLDVFPEMQHVFQLSAGNMPEADQAIARIGSFLREHLRIAS